MKRYIRSDYIPDMTERYPEGMDTRSYDKGLDDADDPTFTLRDRMEQYIEEANDGDFYRNVSVTKGGKEIYHSHSLDDAYEEMNRLNLLDDPIDSSYWHDEDILFTLRR